MTAKRYALGLDYGTSSVRALLVDVRNGGELATAVCAYESGVDGVVQDARHPNLARQNPADYLKGAEVAVRLTLARGCAHTVRAVRRPVTHEHIEGRIRVAGDEVRGP